MIKNNNKRKFRRDVKKVLKARIQPVYFEEINGREDDVKPELLQLAKIFGMEAMDLS